MNWPAASASALDKAKKLYDVVQKLDNTDYTGKVWIPLLWNSIPAGSVETV
jgi:hypothetical protein